MPPLDKDTKALYELRSNLLYLPNIECLERLELRIVPIAKLPMLGHALKYLSLFCTNVTEIPNIPPNL